MICDGWRVRLPRRSELEDDVRSLELPRRSVRHVVEGHVVQFDPQVLKMGTDRGAEWTWALNRIAAGILGERHMHGLGLVDWFSA